jgi:uncharacterized protein with GYD domain
MPLFITLWKYTAEGMRDIHNTAKRFEAVKKIIEGNGGKLVSIYGLVGEYDVITIMELPNKSKLVSTILKIASSGRIVPKTLQALPLEEFLSITNQV